MTEMNRWKKLNTRTKTHWLPLSSMRSVADLSHSPSFPCLSLSLHLYLFSTPLSSYRPDLPFHLTTNATVSPLSSTFISDLGLEKYLPQD
jgi:hypothetical protein